MEYNIPVTKDNIHKAILTTIAFTLNLSELELDILATLLRNNLYIIDSKAREVLRLALDKNKFQTENYISRLKKKNLIIQAADDKKWYLNPDLKPIVESDTISFKFNLAKEEVDAVD